ncbi:hypothetical protein [Nannocystis sp. SCPEA4]|jgi:hypothetical protein|uniref:hypothetical protein n=1 Tax=Nannocystis sp. SCPEA4 TaxID=2996787 RepID=UPI00227173AF|nr:hypothetical protein [Nannocystis sp. SCPEA4]MCY1059848.1 hypothetical protein [Nannocystis sp. SCPEA4]
MRLVRLSPLYFVATTAALVWPLYPLLGDHIEPRVLGMPWSLAYVLLIILANTAVLVGLYLSRSVDAVEAEDDGRG